MIASYHKDFKTVNNLYQYRIFSWEKEVWGVKIGEWADKDNDNTSYSSLKLGKNEYFYAVPPDDSLLLELRATPDIEKQIKSQQSIVEEYSKIFEYSRSLTNLVEQQYHTLFFYRGYGFLISDILKKEYKKEDGSHIPKEDIVEIDTEEFLKAIWATFDVYLHGEWHHIDWQESLLYDSSRIIIVVGSRQIGKSYTMAIRALLSTMKGTNRDTWVFAYLSETTEHIKKYIYRFIDEINSKYSDNIFKIDRQKSIITNNMTNSRIIFRSLSEWWDRVRWNTLHEVIMDECYLIDDEIFDNVILPTVTVTWGTICMISTPWPKNWFFREVQKAKQKMPNYSYYEIDITRNPFIDPVMREIIMSRKHLPSTQREYFCKFVDVVDSVFRPKVITSHDFFRYTPNAHFVFANDPARKGKDRSAYACIMVHNGKIYLFRSWFIPDHMKDKWENQFTYLLNIKKDYPYKHVIDASWLWDGAVTLFQQRTKIDMAITYASWDGDTEDTSYPYWWTRAFKVGKSRMITNMQDFFDNEICEVYKYWNEDFLKELEWLTETKTKLWQVGFETSWYDDITNAVMIWLYYIYKENLISRALLTPNVIAPNPLTEDRRIYNNYQTPRISNYW